MKFSRFLLNKMAVVLLHSMCINLRLVLTSLTCCMNTVKRSSCLWTSIRVGHNKLVKNWFTYEQRLAKPAWGLGHFAVLASMLDVITHSCPNHKDDFEKPSSKLGYGWVTASHIQKWRQLFVHNIRLTSLCYKHVWGVLLQKHASRPVFPFTNMV